MSGKSLYYDIINMLKVYGDYAEIYIEKTEYNSIVFEDKNLERFENVHDSGIGFRLIRDFKTYYAFTNSFEIQDIKECAEAICKYSESGNSDYLLDFTKKEFDYNYKKLPKDINIKDKIELVKRVDSNGWNSNLVKQVVTTYKDTIKNVRIINTEGCDYSQQLSYITLFCTVICEKDGVIQTGYESLGGLYDYDTFIKEDVEKVSEKALKRALLNLDADYAPAGEMTVVLSSSAGGTMIHEAVGHGLEADLATNGLSVYQGRLGEKVASEKITVVDDATFMGKRGSFLFDDEGVEAQKTVLIKDGVLISYMYDRLYAMKNGVQSTGNGRRQSYRYKPIVRMTNTYIESGKDDPEDIIKSVDKGILVVKMGGGQVNTVNGDFVFEVNEGYLLENGEVKKPIRNATLIGNGPKIMQEIDMVGSDLGFGIGTCGKDGQGVPISDAQPTIRIPRITVGGK
ncbi:TldD/PmbA family protein [Deferribacter autotrophicus]|uniref:TldD/PmbA family protein n=1 Tax=Deferribacter autotrophicus TaxID=500465 RepID=A0A5A8F8U7_9BACT|nr:TldD/PmbA family protein [Deferribacter autotrophicus]KAA0259311.1 TldD/PmbA family protein [Deferribacter autotrophicus]